MESPAVLLFLKQTKNAVIGNPTAKLALHQEGVVDKCVSWKFSYVCSFLTNSWITYSIVRYVNASTLFQAVETTFPEETVTQIRIEAANVLASLSRGEIGSCSRGPFSNPYYAYKSLGPLHSVQGIIAAGVPTALLTALQDLQPTDPVTLRIALVRALRTVCIAISESALTTYDLPEHEIEMRSEARAVLDCLFQVRLYYPLHLYSSSHSEQGRNDGYIPPFPRGPIHYGPNAHCGTTGIQRQSEKASNSGDGMDAPGRTYTNERETWLGNVCSCGCKSAEQARGLGHPTLDVST